MTIQILQLGCVHKPEGSARFYPTPRFGRAHRTSAFFVRDAQIPSQPGRVPVRCRRRPYVRREIAIPMPLKVVKIAAKARVLKVRSTPTRTSTTVTVFRTGS